MEIHLKKATFEDILAEIPVPIRSRRRDSDLSEITLQVDVALSAAQQTALEAKLATYGYTVSFK